MLSVVVLMFLLPAVAFMWLEPHWGFLDSLYYCFISLTTVGLGDFIPGDSPGQSWRPLYKACTTCKKFKFLGRWKCFDTNITIS